MQCRLLAGDLQPSVLVRPRPIYVELPYLSLSSVAYRMISPLSYPNTISFLFIPQSCYKKEQTKKVKAIATAHHRHSKSAGHHSCPRLTVYPCFVREYRSHLAAWFLTVLNKVTGSQQHTLKETEKTRPVSVRPGHQSLAPCLPGCLAVSYVLCIILIPDVPTKSYHDSHATLLTYRPVKLISVIPERYTIACWQVASQVLVHEYMWTHLPYSTPSATPATRILGIIASERGQLESRHSACQC